MSIFDGTVNLNPEQKELSTSYFSSSESVDGPFEQFIKLGFLLQDSCELKSWTRFCLSAAGSQAQARQGSLSDLVIQETHISEHNTCLSDPPDQYNISLIDVYY